MIYFFLDEFDFIMGDVDNFVDDASVSDEATQLHINGNICDLHQLCSCLCFLDQFVFIMADVADLVDYYIYVYLVKTASCI